MDSNSKSIASVLIPRPETELMVDAALAAVVPGHPRRYWISLPARAQSRLRSPSTLRRQRHGD